MSLIYVMRHGHAEPPARSDAERPLSLEGAQALQAAGPGLVSIGVSFDDAVMSPLTRTVQTVETVLRSIHCEVQPQPRDFLRPGADPELVTDRLIDRGAQSLLVVGHMPDVSYLVGYLVGGQAFAAVAFSPGTMACIEFVGRPRPGSGVIRWAMSTEQIITLGLGGTGE